MSSKKKESLAIDGLISWLGGQFSSFEDNRGLNKSVSMRDCLLSGFAMFSLKDPSMLFFLTMCVQSEKTT